MCVKESILYYKKDRNIMQSKDNKIFYVIW